MSWRDDEPILRSFYPFHRPYFDGKTEDILNTHRQQKMPTSKSSRWDHPRQSFGSSLMMPFFRRMEKRGIDDFSIFPFENSSVMRDEKKPKSSS